MNLGNRSNIIRLHGRKTGTVEVASPNLQKFFNRCRAAASVVPMLFLENRMRLWYISFMKKIFISYAHKDEEWKDRLVTQLKVLQLEGFCDVWDDRKIGVGDDWKPGIETALKEAHIAILMVGCIESPIIRSRS
ncbi:MAG: toll/interleukin-1 receptor domain-containing protein [bacterium]|nr:toll/interleukin-1 receptor domain-containing protein [bacterium]